MYRRQYDLYVLSEACIVDKCGRRQPYVRSEVFLMAGSTVRSLPFWFSSLDVSWPKRIIADTDWSTREYSVSVSQTHRPLLPNYIVVLLNWWLLCDLVLRSLAFASHLSVRFMCDICLCCGGVLLCCCIGGCCVISCGYLRFGKDRLVEIAWRESLHNNIDSLEREVAQRCS